jgi:hypothetical protein
MASALRSLSFVASLVASCLLAGPAFADFITPSWRGTADTTWYQWANPYGTETSLGGDPELFSYAPGSSFVPAPAPSGSASLVTPLVPISTGNLYNGAFGIGTFAPDPFTLSVPSFLESGSAGTVTLQVRGSLGFGGMFISTPQLLVGSGSVAATLVQQVVTGTAGGGGFGSSTVESLYAWNSVATDGGELQIVFTNGNHVSLMGFSVDTSRTVAVVPEPTSAASAAAGVLAAAGLAGRRLLRRRRRATSPPAPTGGPAPASPSSSSSSSSPSSRC